MGRKIMKFLGKEKAKPEHHYRHIGEKIVKPIKMNGKMYGTIDGIKLVLSTSGNPIPYKQIGISAKEFYRKNENINLNTKFHL